MPILEFIAQLRTRGYDRQFRAGQSIYNFVLSRSREHGLRENQPRITFSVRPEGGMDAYFYKAPDSPIKIQVEKVEITPEVENLLQRLLSHPND